MIYLLQIRTATANKRFAIAEVPCFADSLVQGGSSVLRTKFSAKTPRHRPRPELLWASLLDSSRL
jgi:hypothetical protein